MACGVCMARGKSRFIGADRWKVTDEARRSHFNKKVSAGKNFRKYSLTKLSSAHKKVSLE
jgi:hypothetical protein